MADETKRTDKEVYWVPLESNPDMLNKFAHGLGLPENYGFVDVYGIDEDLLAFVPSPRLGVTLLFDFNSEKTKEFKTFQGAPHSIAKHAPSQANRSYGSQN